MNKEKALVTCSSKWMGFPVVLKENRGVGMKIAELMAMLALKMSERNEGFILCIVG